MIECNKLTRRYGKTLALDGIDLHIGAGELHAFVGPNGAGKTTAMRILATLMRYSSCNSPLSTSRSGRLSAVTTSVPRLLNRGIGLFVSVLGIWRGLYRRKNLVNVVCFRDSVLL